jgi:hypothetical protein
MISEVDTAPSNIKEAKKQAIDSSDDTEICLQYKLQIGNNLHAVSCEEWNTEDSKAVCETLV